MKENGLISIFGQNFGAAVLSGTVTRAVGMEIPKEYQLKDREVLPEILRQGYTASPRLVWLEQGQGRAGLLCFGQGREGWGGKGGRDGPCPAGQFRFSASPKSKKPPTAVRRPFRVGSPLAVLAACRLALR